MMDDICLTTEHHQNALSKQASTNIILIIIIITKCKLSKFDLKDKISALNSSAMLWFPLHKSQNFLPHNLHY